jgi:hypothetical protein
MANLKNVIIQQGVDVAAMVPYTLKVPSNVSKIIMAASVVDQKNRDIVGTGTITATARTRLGLIDFVLNVDNGSGGNGNGGGSGSEAALSYDISTKAPQLIEVETIGKIVFSCANVGYTAPATVELVDEISNNYTLAALDAQAVLTFTQGEFTVDDIGKSFIFKGAGLAGADLTGTIVDVASNVEITLSTNILTATADGAVFNYGDLFVAEPRVQFNIEMYI